MDGEHRYIDGGRAHAGGGGRTQGGWLVPNLTFIWKLKGSDSAAPACQGRLAAVNMAATMLYTNKQFDKAMVYFFVV